MSAELRTAILAGLEYSYLHDDWVSPLSEELEGVSAEDARWRLTPDSKSIWEIVLHLAVWNENIVERVNTGEKAHPKEGAWPQLPDELTEQNWTDAKRRLEGSLAQMRIMIETVPMEKLFGPPYGLGDLLCRFTHMGYHIGQITKLNEARRAYGNV